MHFSFSFRSYYAMLPAAAFGKLTMLSLLPLLSLLLLLTWGPSPVSASASPWQPILPKGPCTTNEDCSLNGICTGGSCACTASWTGHNCQYLNLEAAPKIAGYGWQPNVSSWGGSIYRNATDPAGLYHLYVTEETGGRGLASWVTNSQIVHAVSQSPLGPYSKKDVVSPPPTTNPQVLYDPSSGTFLLFHIRGSGSFQLYVSASVDGPWTPHRFSLGGCNNPTAAFHPNGTLYVMCHDSQFSLYSFNATDGKPAWQGAASAPTPTLTVGKNKNVPGNCEDPFLYFDRHGRFHVIAHCYTCYWYPLPDRPGPSSKYYPPGKGSGCLPGSAFCAGHGFSTTGAEGNWTWIGGGDAPYNFTSEAAQAQADEGAAATTRAFSTRERPWALLGGAHGDDFIALVNGVSGGYGQPGDYIKYIDGKDWTYTNIQPVAH